MLPGRRSSPAPASAAPTHAKPAAPSAKSHAAPASTAHHGPCACGGTCPRCAAAAAPGLAGQDFSGVRIHPHASNITTPLQARAVTIGQDVYFHPGEYQPGTPEGDHLIAHELAHTLQTRNASTDEVDTARSVSEPGDAVEANADELASGQTDRVLAASPQTALRTPFDNETAEQRTRRLSLIQSIGNAQNTLINLLRTGGLIARSEVAVERGGVRGVVVPASTAGRSDESFVSYTEREARIRRIIGFLQSLGRQYRAAPIAADFTAPTRHDEDAQPSYSSSVSYESPTGPVNAAFVGNSPEWADLQGAYARYLVSQGLMSEEYELDWYYIDPAATVTPGAARGARRVSSGIATGAYMVVPDIDNEPLRYWRLDGFSPTPEGSVIVEFWHDDFGYYYMHRGQRIDVPSPWRSSTR